MKTVFTCLLVLAALCSFCQATTQTEYNYMKNGYKETEEKGLDVKKGYTAIELQNQVYGPITLVVTKLMRTDNSTAGLILKTVSTDAFGSGTKYYCIPAVNLISKESYGWADFYKDVNIMTETQKGVVLKWLAYRLQFETNNVKL